MQNRDPSDQISYEGSDFIKAYVCTFLATPVVMLFCSYIAEVAAGTLSVADYNFPSVPAIKNFLGPIFFIYSVGALIALPAMIPLAVIWSCVYFTLRRLNLSRQSAAVVAAAFPNVFALAWFFLVSKAPGIFALAPYVAGTSIISALYFFRDRHRKALGDDCFDDDLQSFRSRPH